MADSVLISNLLVTKTYVRISVGNECSKTQIYSAEQLENSAFSSDYSLNFEISSLFKLSIAKRKRVFSEKAWKELCTL